MAINKKLIHFNTFENFNSKKLSANVENTQYTLGVNGEIQTGSPEILYRSIVFIKDTKQQWTHGQLYSGGNSSSSSAYPEISHGTSDTTFTLTPNTFHIWNEVTVLDLSFGEEAEGIANEFLFQFTSGTTATTLTLPDTVKWANDEVPTIEPNMIYQVSILKGLASVLKFSNVPNVPNVFPAILPYIDQDQELNLRVYNEIHSIAQGSNITLNSGDLTFVINENIIPVTNLSYYSGYNSSYTGYILHDTVLVSSSDTIEK